MSDRVSGTVKWFNNAKGFGFIERKDGEDVFVHYNQIRGDGYRSLSDGQQVEFSVTKTEKGYQAEDVDGFFARISDLMRIAYESFEIKRKQLYVNGELQVEPLVVHKDPRVYEDLPAAPISSRIRDNFGPFTVPPGTIFCLGDNRDNSTDSRVAQGAGGVGYVPFDHLIGRADRIMFSSAGRSLPPCSW